MPSFNYSSGQFPYPEYHANQAATLGSVMSPSTMNPNAYPVHSHPRAVTPYTHHGAGVHAYAAHYGSAGLFSAYRSTLMSHSFDLRYDVQLVPQLTGFSCWAAGFAMIVGWAERMSIDPSEIARATGYWEQYKNGLHPEDVIVMSVWGFVAEPPQTYTVPAFVELLRNYGPLWVASAEPGPHIRVVAGIYGDGTPDGTKLLINDPWDINANAFTPNNRGSQYEETYREFVAKQSTLAGREMNYDAPVYVAHLPQLPEWARAGGYGYPGSAVNQGGFVGHAGYTTQHYGNPVVIELGSTGWEDRVRQAVTQGLPIKLTLKGPDVDRIYEEFVRQRNRWDAMRNRMPNMVGFDVNARYTPAQAMLTGGEIVLSIAALIVVLALVGLLVYRDILLEMIRQGYCGDAKITGNTSGSSGANDPNGAATTGGQLEINLERCSE